MAIYSVPPRILLYSILICTGIIFTAHFSSQVSHPIETTNNLAANVQKHFNSVSQHFANNYGAAPGFEEALPSCRVTDLYDDPLVKEYGISNIKLSRSYEGSGERVKKILKKAMHGEKIRIAVVGGSVSAGHAIEYPLTEDNYMYMHIHKWFKDTFPKAEHTLDLEAARPATTNLYFSYCLLEHLPQDVDLVFVEMDINSNPRSDESILATDAVFRTILSLPTKPAIIYMSVVALSFDDMIHGWMPSVMLAQWHDIPMINIRNFILPHYFAHPEKHKQLFTNWASDYDPRHMNSKAHIALGNMAIAYMREQLCLMQRDAPKEPKHDPSWPGLDITTTIPRLDILAKWSETESLPPFHPRCRSINSANDPLVPTENKGWTNVTHNGKMGYEATEIGSQITFEFDTAAGLAGYWFWHTWDEKFASADCWVDGDQAPHRLRHIDAYDPNMTAPVYDWTRNIWDDLTPGKHTMTCKTVPGVKGGNIFRISATVTR